MIIVAIEEEYYSPAGKNVARFIPKRLKIHSIRRATFIDSLLLKIYRFFNRQKQHTFNIKNPIKKSIGLLLTPEQYSVLMSLSKNKIDTNIDRELVFVLDDTDSNYEIENDKFPSAVQNS